MDQNKSQGQQNRNQGQQNWNRGQTTQNPNRDEAEGSDRGSADISDRSQDEELDEQDDLPDRGTGQSER